MLIDLIAQQNYNSYNVQLAKIIGLHPAIYVNVLLNINSKAIQKQRITDEEYFTVDRNYIKLLTTFDIPEQKDIEELLKKLGIIRTDNVEDSSTFSLNISTLTSIMMSENETLISDINKITKQKSGRRTKSDVIKEELKSYIHVTNQELYDAYCDWIDAVMAKQGWMSKKSVTSAQTIVDEFSQRDLDVALKLIEIASIGGYRDMTWAVNSYKDNYKVQYKITKNSSTTPVKVSDEVF